MTGPEHYRYAESLLPTSVGKDSRLALIHAVLALAAATALGGDHPPEDQQSTITWRDVISDHAE